MADAAAVAAVALNGLLVIDKPGLGRDAIASEVADSEVADSEVVSDSAVHNASTDLPTSHDVVQRVRRWSRQRRIGHTGTLDPMASGVLVLCLGNATRLVEYYQGHNKEYTAAVTLGASTDTYDALGQVTETRPVPPLDVNDVNDVKTVEEVLAQFRGEILQRPPIYSALKQGGESLHRKARRGEEVTVESRPATVYRLELLSFDEPDRLWLRVVCSAGFYVRSLAHDIGQALGTGGHLSYLRRESAGEFSVADAHTLAALENAAQSDTLASLLLPPGAGLDLPRLLPNPDEARRLGMGQRIWLPQSRAESESSIADTTAETTEEAIVQAVDREGRLLGIVRVLEKSSEPGGGLLCKAEKWLAPQSSG